MAVSQYGVKLETDSDVIDWGANGENHCIALKGSLPNAPSTTFQQDLNQNFLALLKY